MDAGAQYTKVTYATKTLKFPSMLHLEDPKIPRRRVMNTSGQSIKE